MSTRLALALTAVMLVGAPAPADSVKLTGWLACEKCTASRVAKGDLRPSNPDCARQCIEKGSDPVFISEQGKEMLKVANFAAVKDHLGFHIEVTGKREAGTISIDSVKTLSEQGASCSRPKSSAKR
jgi:hypothetical protein